MDPLEREQRFLEEIRLLKLQNEELKKEVCVLHQKVVQLETKTPEPEHQTSGLPQTTFLEILKRLSVCDLIRARFVCKHWEATILSPYFAKYWKEQPWADKTWVIVNKEGAGPELWNPGSSLSPCSIPLHPPYCADFRVMASSNGLICGRIMDAYDIYLLVVGNPFFPQSWKQLPPAPCPEFWFEKENEGGVLVEMQVDENSGTYKVAILPHDPSHLESGVKWIDQYDSRKGTWRQPPAPRYRWEDAEGSSNLHGTFAVFAVVMFSIGIEEGPINLAAYDLTSGGWTEITTHFPVFGDRFDSVHDTKVFLYQGSYMLASGLLKGEKLVAFAIWKLDEQKVWKCVSTLATRKIADRREANAWLVNFDAPFKSMVEGNIVVFYSDPEHAKKRGWSPVVSYDLEKNEWHVLSESVRRSARVKYLVTCLLHPSLSLRQ